MAQNMYRVGDYVYFELSSSAPFQVRRIEELNKTSSGNVEAKVTSFYRRRDIPRALLKIADKAERFGSGNSVNSKRRLALPSSNIADINGNMDLISSASSTGDGSKEMDNSASETTEKTREDSESPRPMQVDVQEEQEDEEETSQDQKSDSEKEICEGGYGIAGLPTGSENLTPHERHILRQHEVFLSRQAEALPATHIRGKCSVTLLSEVESPESYMDREDAFFYSLVYDPVAMTLLADKGEIRVGDKYQCFVPDDGVPIVKEENKENSTEESADGATFQRDLSPTDREVLVYHPYHSLTDRDIDQFLIVARAVGTFSRALDTSSSVKLPSLHMTAAAASRDVTLLHAMALLHQANYDLGQAVKYLVPPPSKQHYPLDADKTTTHHTVSLGGPILCRDQIEEWSAAEANLFEEAIDKYGKDFNDIRADYLPWKSLRDIIEYYYMWKTTNRYVEVKKNKALDQESKLKQVYIPNYNKPNPNLVGPPNPSGQPLKGISSCESCQTEVSAQWYAWGPAQLQLRLCSECWIHWKKYGGLRKAHDYESYDLDGSSTQENSNSSLNSNHSVKSVALNFQAPPIVAKSVTTSVATQQSRNGGIALRPSGGQIVARLPASAQLAMGVQPKTAIAAVPAKTRVAFFLNTTLSTRIARRLAPKTLLNVRRSARRPFLAINGQAIKQYCTTRQPIEIIRAAKQIKSKRIPDAFLAQLAASIISSASHFGSSNAMKRPNISADKTNGKKTCLGIQPKAMATSQQQQQQNLPANVPIALAQQTSAPSVIKASPSKASGSALRSLEVKPVATVPPLPLPPNITNPLAAINSIHSPLLGQPTAAPSASGSRNVPVVGIDRKSMSLTKKTHGDSRWSGVDERLLFLAGPRLKDQRQRVCTKRIIRHLALHPCSGNEFVKQQWPLIQQFFL